MRGFAGRKDLSWLFLFVSAFLFVTPALMGQQSKLVPVIYATDLFHPPGDPDDTVDLAILYSVPELDIRAIILDQGLQQRREPGEIPVKQMTVLTGRQTPYATGLLNPLRYPQDAALNQFGTAQSGVNLILRTLRESDQRVVIITVGSVRDVAAAFNREPALFEQKVDRIYVNAGNSGGGDFQWNPFLDPQAYLRLMQSNLPIYWAPSFDGRGSPELFIAGRWEAGPHQTNWRFQQREIFDVLPHPLQNYFLYALGKKISSHEDPIAYLKKTHQEHGLKQTVWKSYRNMWSTVTFLHAAGRQLYRKGDTWAALSAPVEGYDRSLVYEFVPSGINLDQDLRTTLKPPDSNTRFRVFRLVDPQNYQQAMLTSLRTLLTNLPLSSEFRN